MVIIFIFNGRWLEHVASSIVQIFFSKVICLIFFCNDLSSHLIINNHFENNTGHLNVPGWYTAPQTSFVVFFVHVLLQCAYFFRKKKTDKFFCEWIAQAENFLPLIVILSVFSGEKHSKKKAVWQQRFIVFSSVSFFDKKLLCWERKWAFFRSYSL